MSNKMIQKDPTIRKDKSRDRWLLNYYENGQRRKRYFKTKELAERERKTVLAQRNAVHFDCATIVDAINEYRKLVSVKKAAGKLERKYFIDLAQFLHDECGRELMDEIKPTDLIGYRNYRLETVGASMVNREFSTFKHFFKKAKAWGLSSVNPAESIERMPESENPHQGWTYRELEIIVAAVSPQMGRLIRFIAATGCRPSEAKKIKWKDVDLTKMTVTFRSLKGGKGELVDTIPLVDEGADPIIEIAELERTRFKRKPDDYVFLNEEGYPFSRCALSKAVQRACDRQKLRALVPYGLRHMVGEIYGAENIELARRVLRHRSIRTTQRYTNLKLETLREKMTNVTQQREGLG